MLRLQQRGGLRFALEAAQLRLRRGLGVAERFMLDELDRRIAREQAMARPPHRAHAAGAELLDQLIAAQLPRFANLAAHLLEHLRRQRRDHRPDEVRQVEHERDTGRQHRPAAAGTRCPIAIGPIAAAMSEPISVRRGVVGMIIADARMSTAVHDGRPITRPSPARVVEIEHGDERRIEHQHPHAGAAFAMRASCGQIAGTGTRRA